MDFRRDLASGVFYTAIAKYAGMAVTLVVTAVLARRFTPEEFGIVNVATVFISFFNILCDLGVGPAVIQKDLDDEDLNSVFKITLISGFVLSVIFFYVADIVSAVYDGSWVLKALLKILSISIFFNSANMVPNALIMKAKRFSFAALRSFAVQLVCGAAAVIAAYSGLGIYALIINPIASSIILFAINYLQHPLNPLHRIKRSSIEKIRTYTVYQFSFQLVNYFGRNLDKLLMGKYMSMTELGYYDKSYRLMMLPLQNLTFVITPVLHPVFAQVQSDKQRIASSYIKMLHFLAIIGFPMAAGLFFMARNLVMVFFGGQWALSIPAFQILALSVGFQLLSSTTGSIFQASNATDKMFFCGLFGTGCTISAICLGVFLFGTTNAVASFVAVAFFLSFLQCFYVLFKKCLKTGWKEFWASLISPAILAVLMSIVLFCVRTFVIEQYFAHITHLAELIVYVAVWGVVWLGYVFATRDEVVVGMIRSILKR